jgi:DNA-binding SARP family transcriptional activator
MADAVSDHSISLRCLGQTALVSDAAGEERALLPMGKPLALFTFLACAPERTATREQLIDLLWSDVERESARHTLRQTLWYLKRRIGTDPFVSRGDTLTLALDLHSDREAFLAALEAGEYATAVERYGGDFLPGFAAPGGAEFEQWADLERHRLRGLFLRAAESLVRQLIGEWRPREAVPIARRARTLVPDAQATWRLLLEALLAADDRLAALSEAEQLEQWLAREETPVEAATATLLRQVRSESVRPAPAPAEESLSAELVGRDREFAQLMEAWTNARRGRATHVHITARAGLGKSRLLDGLARRLRAAKARVVTVRALQANRDLPCALAADLTLALARLRGAAGVSPDVASTLVALAPGVSTYLSAPPDRTTGDDALRRRTLALQELVTTIADDAPVAVLVDDVHWADAPSRTMLASVAASLAAVPVLLVTASRQVDPQLGVDERTQLLPLAPLTEEDVGALLRSLGELPDGSDHEAGADASLDTLATRLSAATGGSPLLLLETLQLALERGALRVQERVWQCPDPNTLSAILRSGSAMRDRLLAVSDAHQGTMLLFAVIGTELDAAAVERAAGAEGTAALHELESRGLLAHRNGSWIIAHDELAELTRELASASRLARAHRQAASLLEASAQDSPNLLLRAAHHRHEAGDRTEASLLLARVARLTDAVGDRAALGALAQSVIGANGTRAQRDALLDALPWRTRTNLGRLAIVTAVSSALLLAATAAWHQRGLSAVSPPDAVLYLPVFTAEESTLVRVDLREDQLRHVDALDARAEPTPMTTLRALARMHPIYLAQGDTVIGTSWAYGSDAGGELQAVRLADGRALRYTDSPGDDYAATAGPDAQSVVFVSARWDSMQRSDLAVLDRATRQVRRLTRSPDAETLPLLSPDGSRIVFSRTYATVRPSTLCWISLDGLLEECVPATPELIRPMPLGWYDSEQVYVSSESDESGATRLSRVHLRTGRTVLLDDGADSYQLSPSGAFVLALYRSDGTRATELAVFTPDQPSRRVPVRWRGATIPYRAGSQLWRDAGRRSERITEVHIRGIPPEVPSNGRVQLTLAAQTQRSVAYTPPAVWWQSLDTTRATVRSDGLLLPRAPGAVRIVGSAGGWRADTATITITPPRVGETVFEERWSTLDTTRWLTFGTPAPFVERGTLRVNGDRHLHSGVVSWPRILPDAGMGLEIEFQLPMTELQWQNVTVGFAPKGTDAQLAAWTGRAGPDPNAIIDGPTDDRLCLLTIPRGEMGDHAGQLMLSSGRSSTPVREFPITPTDGAWHTLRVQLFSDGRCGAAIDGIIVARSQLAIPMDMPMRVLIQGQSMFTQVRVGALSVWRGERLDLPWHALDQSATP